MEKLLTRKLTGQPTADLINENLFKRDGAGRLITTKAYNGKSYLKGANDNLHIYYGLPYGLLHMTSNGSDDWTAWGIFPVSK